MGEAGGRRVPPASRGPRRGVAEPSCRAGTRRPVESNPSPWGRAPHVCDLCSPSHVRRHAGPSPRAEGDAARASVSGEPRFPSHLFLEQRSPPPPPPPPTLLSGAHPVPAPSPLPFTQPGPAFSQQGQQPVFPRERPVRPALQPPGPLGILHFSQPGSAATRPFIPPRQPFLPGPGQPFLPAHAQPSLQVCGGGAPRRPGARGPRWKSQGLARNALLSRQDRLSPRPEKCKKRWSALGK